MASAAGRASRATTCAPKRAQPPTCSVRSRTCSSLTWPGESLMSVWRAPMADDCIFCQIVVGQIPSDVVFRGAGVTAFRDIHPEAPIHILVIPDEHISG